MPKYTLASIKIIVTTIHKFYYILNNNLLGNLKAKKFAVLIDEAHSSTEGIFMQSVTNVLTNEGDDEDGIAEEDKMLEEIRKSGKQGNVSMIAFTATGYASAVWNIECRR